jgi:putative transposase
VIFSATTPSSDNAKAESFFTSLKQEEVCLKEYKAFQEAQRNIGQFLDEMYNLKKLLQAI